MTAVIGETLPNNSEVIVLVAGKFSNLKAWDWVAVIPIPSQADASVHPVEPSQGSSLIFK